MKIGLTTLVVVSPLPLLLSFLQFCAVGLHRYYSHYDRVGAFLPRVAIVVQAWNEAAVIGALLVMAVLGWLALYTQQITINTVGNRLLVRLRSDMYEHMQGLSLSFYDEMEVGRMISRLTSDVTVIQDLLTSGSLNFAADFIGLGIVILVIAIVAANIYARVFKLAW
mgnify:CR=1 FL=1